MPRSSLSATLDTKKAPEPEGSGDLVGYEDLIYRLRISFDRNENSAEYVPCA